MKQDSPGIAVIGSGYWGKNLVRNYQALGALKMICDRDEEVLKRFSEQYPDVETCLSPQGVFSREDVAGIVVATPAETHFNIVREALLAGKHVYVEKPLVLEEADGENLIALSRENNLILMVGHLLQYHPAFVRLRKLAGSGELGRINYIYSHRLNLGKIRREENILWSFAPHDISMILSLAGEYPESVQATGGNYLHKKIADVTTTHLDFPSGLRAHIFVSWLHPFKVQQLVVVGDRKMAVFDDTCEWDSKLLLYPHEIHWQNGIPVPAKAEAERIHVEPSEPLRVECEHFLNCIRDGHTPLTDGSEGVRVLRILNAGQQSLDRGGAKIELAARVSVVPKPSVPFFAHESACIDKNVTIGEGTKVWHFTHVLPGTRIGERCNIGQNVVIGPDVMVGNDCKIQNNVSVYKGVTLEDGVFCGPSMVFTNVYNPRAEIKKMDQARPTLVQHGATIGANATVVCGVTLGKYCFIGAGAVVNRNVPDHALVVGNPAKVIGWVCACGERLSDDLCCESCGNEYERNGAGLSLTKSESPAATSIG